ncbi:VOC family protein [Catelliglobosispora koreensis]|uniref:VOC family protein n=1 Tax=Catelliglobosispora koreensis TaxID=129052 RepID=UPI000367C2FB|nr:VOC family protein [Catelliglobosispora koreensis]
MASLQTGHIGLNVSDLDQSVAFYERLFGFSTRRFDGYAFLNHDGVLMVTLWQQSTQSFATDRPGLHHLSFAVPDIPAVEHVEATLREMGVAIRDDSGVPSEVSESGQIFFHDPDGIRLEVYSLTPGKPRAATSQPACGFF